MRFQPYDNQLRRTRDKIWSTLYDHRAKSLPDILIGQVRTWNCFHEADPDAVVTAEYKRDMHEFTSLCTQPVIVIGITMTIFAVRALDWLRVDSGNAATHQFLPPLLRIIRVRDFANGSGTSHKNAIIELLRYRSIDGGSRISEMCEIILPFFRKIDKWLFYHARCGQYVHASSKNGVIRDIYREKEGGFETYQDGREKSWGNEWNK